MKKLVDGKIYVAPNGETKVKVFPHGFIEPVGEISEQVGSIIQEMSRESARQLGKSATPFKVFEHMGWKEIAE